MTTTCSKEALSYGGAHARVRSARGPAREHACHCGAPARTWAYGHADPRERWQNGSPYSTDPRHYVALCVPCHRALDSGRLAGGRGVGHALRALLAAGLISDVARALIPDERTAP